MRMARLLHPPRWRCLRCDHKAGHLGTNGGRRCPKCGSLSLMKIVRL